MAGSSVFPTGGAMNPTLTIVAPALRLADHLETDLGVRAPLVPAGRTTYPVPPSLASCRAEIGDRHLMTDHTPTASVSSTAARLRAALKRVLKYEPHLGSASMTFPCSSPSARNNVDALILFLELDSALQCSEVQLTGRDPKDEVLIEFKKRPDADNASFFKAMETIQNALE